MTTRQERDAIETRVYGGVDSATPTDAVRSELIDALAWLERNDSLTPDVIANARTLTRLHSYFRPFTL